MDSIGLPMAPDLKVFPKPIRIILLAILIIVPLGFAAAVLIGIVGQSMVTLEAKVVDSPPTESEVYELLELPDEGPTQAAVVEATKTGSATYTVKRMNIRLDSVRSGAVYVRYDGRVVEVVLGS